MKGFPLPVIILMKGVSLSRGSTMDEATQNIIQEQIPAVQELCAAGRTTSAPCTTLSYCLCCSV